MKSIYGNSFETIDEAVELRWAKVRGVLVEAWGHLIKWYCQPFNQSTSWIGTIMLGIKVADKYIKMKPKEKERIINFDADSMFKEAYSIAVEDILSGFYNKNNAPYIPTSRDELDPRFDIENLFSLDYVYNLMKETLCTNIPGIDSRILADKRGIETSLRESYIKAKKYAGI